MKKIREIKVVDLFTYFILPFIMFIVLTVIEIWISHCEFVIVIKILAYTVCAVFTYPLLKRFVIGIVLMYKAFAPMAIRKRCRYEPSCSTYMIMAVNKYGLFKGVYKGIRRIVRCTPPNGGKDYP